VKRFIDVIIAFHLILLLCPLLIVTAVLIRSKMTSPVLFKQKRPGLYEKPFMLYKFRTMSSECDGNGELLPDQQRITGLGSVLRKLSLDELPQLFNVLKGDMSLVGPRPLLMEYLSLYTDEQRVRHHVKPGITGWAQINGRNAITWEEKFQLDSWYVMNRSHGLDIKILFATVFRVVKRNGITQQDHASMEKFTGTKDVM
jgi:sugar transferase EpsL